MKNIQEEILIMRENIKNLEKIEKYDRKHYLRQPLNSSRQDMERINKNNWKQYRAPKVEYDKEKWQFEIFRCG